MDLLRTVNPALLASAFTENALAIGTGLVVAILAGVFLALFARVMSNFSDQNAVRFDAISDEITSMKVDVDRRFDVMEAEVSEVQQFRTEFLSKGWTHMPPGMNDGPGLATTLERMAAKMDTLDAKFDQQRLRFEQHDEWERQQKWSHPSSMHIEGEIHTGPESDG